MHCTNGRTLIVMTRYQGAGHLAKVASVICHSSKMVRLEV